MTDVTDYPVSWWVWCTKCGSRWLLGHLGQCPHTGPDLRPFPDPDIAEAAYRTGGTEAVHGLEVKLWTARIYAEEARMTRVREFRMSAHKALAERHRRKRIGKLRG